jgi:hypothetical protein
VPVEFPVELADRLRARGVEVRADHEEFARRRRAKNAAELAGVSVLRLPPTRRWRGRRRCSVLAAT